MARSATWGSKRFCAHHRHAFYLRSYYIEFMPTLIAGIIAVILLYSLLQMFRAANPVVLARAIKIGGGVVALAVAAFTGIKGELAVAIPIGIFGAGLLGWSPFGASGFGNIGRMFGGSGTQRSPGQTSQVRSQFSSTTAASSQARSWPGHTPAIPLASLICGN